MSLKLAEYLIKKYIDEQNTLQFILEELKKYYLLPKGDKIEIYRWDSQNIPEYKKIGEIGPPTVDFQYINISSFLRIILEKQFELGLHWTEY